MKRVTVAFAATLAIVAAIASGTDGPPTAPLVAAGPIASASPSPNSGVTANPLWRIDVPKVGGPFTSRLSPDARLVAVEAVNARTGVVLYEIQPPVPPSDIAHLRELVRLDRVAGPIAWLPDSSALLAYEPDGPSSATGVLSLVDRSGKRWSISTTGSNAQGARFSPDGRYAAVWANPPGALVIALDGSGTYPVAADETQQFAGWDTEGNLLFHVRTTKTLEARTIGARVVYTIPVPDDLSDMGANVPSFPHPNDVQLLSFDSGGCCRPSLHAARVLFDRKLHDLPAGLEALQPTVGDGPWRGRELTMRREADAELIAFDPRAGVTRLLGPKVPYGQAIWGISGDYLAWGRHIVDLATGRDQEWTVQPPPETIIALGAGRFVLWRDGTTELLDAAAWFAAPQTWTGELPKTSDQGGLPTGWVRVRDDDGGFTLGRPSTWSSYDGPARGAVLESSGLGPSAALSSGEVRIEIRLDIEGPRGPADFLDGLAHHGGGVLERKAVQLAGQSAEFAMVDDNTLLPRPATTLNWALRSPFFPDRIVWIRAWPLEAGRRAEIESVVATLAFVAPR